MQLPQPVETQKFQLLLTNNLRERRRRFLKFSMYCLCSEKKKAEQLKKIYIFCDQKVIVDYIL